VALSDIDQAPKSMGHRFILARSTAYHRHGIQLGVCQQYQNSPHSKDSVNLRTALILHIVDAIEV
jgi:hypothetical protein